jgi:hypothetical protein
MSKRRIKIEPKMRRIKVKINWLIGMLDPTAPTIHARERWTSAAAFKEIPQRIQKQTISNKNKIYLLFVLQYYGHDTKELTCAASK